MKKMKKLFAMLLAFAMIMGMNLTSFAAISGSSIDVTNLSTEAEQTVKIYEIYRLDNNNNLWVLSDWAEEADVLASEADLADAAKIAALAEAVPTSADATKTTTTGSVSFTGLQAGAYLVVATDSLNNTKYNPMVAVTYAYDTTSNLLVAANATTVAKASGYNIDKEFAEGEAVVEVGDLVTYTITTTVPYLAENSADATFKINDTLTGATFFFAGTTDKGETGTFEAKVGTTSVDASALSVNEANNAFVLNLTSFVSAANTFAGQKVKITYTALVNENADLIENNVKSEWAEEVTVKSYTGQITITKYGEAVKTEVDGKEVVTYPTLEGAEFVLYNEAGKFAVVENGYISAWVDSQDAATKLVTGADGTVTVKGLNVGTYSFKEVKAPKGYSINPTDVSDEITANDLTAETEMYDTKLSALPSTGGVGTAAFTIGGCAIMIAAAYFFFVSRKKES